MGRPINKKFFGNLNRPYDNEQTGGNSGTGGEGVSTITVSNSGTLYSQGTTLSIGTPDIAGGIPATLSYSINSAGNITVSVNESGTGYTSAPTLTVTKASTVNVAGTATNNSYTLTNLTSVAGIYVGMQIDADWAMQASTYVTAVNGNAVTMSKTATASTSSVSFAFSDQGSGFAKTVALYASTVTQNAISFTSYLTTGSNAVTGGDILKQEASRRYLVKNSEGIGQVKLASTDALSAGEMKIIATDGAGSTFYVTKLTARKATVVGRTGTSTAVVTTGASVGWTLGAATGTNQVTIASN